MDLVPVSSLPPVAPEPPPGTTEIRLTLDRVQKIGVRTALAERVTASEPMRVTAIVEAPEKGRAEVHSRAAGFVEAIHVRETGGRVKAGALLASIYSPEIFQAQQELLTIASWNDPGPNTQGNFRPPMEPARRRLELLGLDARAIDAIIQSGKAQRAVAVHAPISGYVVKKSVVLGSSVTPEQALFEIADLEHVYVVASVHPNDLARLHVGDGAVFTTPAHPGRSFAAKVALVLPEVDLATRTARARLQLDNRDLALRPGQFGVVEITGKMADVVVVPIDAVVDLGRSAYVFRDEGDGHFSPVTVELGDQLGDKLVVRAGLGEGERVVSGATFLIDAESRLRASLAERVSTSSAPAPTSACDAEFDRTKYPEKWAECGKCEEVHRGMGSMVDDCKNAIAKPWR
jgi:Cu(I)/Ag(I) efflux system membrane fusion protein